MIRWQISNTANCIFNGFPANISSSAIWSYVSYDRTSIKFTTRSNIFILEIELLNFHMITRCMKLTMKYEINFKIFFRHLTAYLIEFW